MLGFESVLEDSQGMYYLDVWNHKESLCHLVTEMEVLGEFWSILA